MNFNSSVIKSLFVAIMSSTMKKVLSSFFDHVCKNLADYKSYILTIKKVNYFFTINFTFSHYHLQQAVKEICYGISLPQIPAHLEFAQLISIHNNRATRVCQRDLNKVKKKF